MGDKKQRILDAAFERFSHFGFLKTTVDEIARQAQVGKGTVYSYFASKEEILLSLVEREFTKEFDKIYKAIVQEESTIGKFRKMIEVSFDYFHKNKLVNKGIYYF